MQNDRNNSVFTQKVSTAEKVNIPGTNHQRIYAKNRAFKINQLQEKCIIQELISNFIAFWQKNNVLTRNGQSFKKYQRQKKVHNSIISHEKREFCPIFIEIIA